MRLDGMCVTDSGTCAGTISVDPPLEGHWMLQDAINRRHLQAYVHAISEMSNWLILRINRFRQDASDGVSKIRSPMRWAAGIHMPVSNDSALSFSKVSFKLRACIVHIGDDAIRGHYRALLIHDGDKVSLMDVKLKLLELLIRLLVMFICCSWCARIHHRISLGHALV